MDHKQPLETLRRNLLRRGLPADYVHRAVEELADHHADLLEGSAAGAAPSDAQAWQRLGDIQQVGNELVRKFHARSFAGRHPLLTFVLTPLPAMAILWVLLFMSTWTALFAVANFLGVSSDNFADTDFVGPNTYLPVWLILAIHYLMVATPPACCAWWFCRTAQKSGRGLSWAAASCFLLMLLSLLVLHELRLRDGGQHGEMRIGLNIPVLPENWNTLHDGKFWSRLVVRLLPKQQQILQGAAPLAVLACFVWRARAATEPAALRLSA